MALAVLLIWITPSLAFDHTYANYSQVLSEHVSTAGVNYTGLCANRSALNSFMSEAAALPFEEYQTFTQEQKLAFLINLYNASVLALVCDHPGIRSINDLKSFFSDAWSIKFIRLFDHTIGLAQLLHDLLRPEFREPRIHFALVTACKSDPELLNVPYRAEILTQQLELQAEKFLTQRPEMNHYEKGILWLSPKLKWYSIDFGKRPSMVRFLQKYFPDVTEKTRIRYTQFNWMLNSQ